MNFRSLVNAAVLTALVCSGAGAVGQASESWDFVTVRPGSLLLRGSEAPAAFRMARHPVTNEDYLDFVRANPQWRRSRVSRLFAEKTYLARWKGDLEPGELAPAEAPVVEVSWFAARAYAAWIGGRLPRNVEWDLVARCGYVGAEAGGDSEYQADLYRWLSRPTPKVLSGPGALRRNYLGLAGFQGLVWEWTEDFNDATVTGESRSDSDLDTVLFCGGAAAGTPPTSDYAVYLRASLRASLRANQVTSSLGFRCVKDLKTP